jgi:hypothetical protein
MKASYNKFLVYRSPFAVAMDFFPRHDKLFSHPFSNRPKVAADDAINV